MYKLENEVSTADKNVWLKIRLECTIYSKMVPTSPCLKKQMCIDWGRVEAMSIFFFFVLQTSHSIDTEWVKEVKPEEYT